MNKELIRNCINAEEERPRRGLNTMGLFAVIASLAMLGAVIAGSGAWVLMLLGTIILSILALAEAIVHRLRFYSIVVSILIACMSIYILVTPS